VAGVRLFLRGADHISLSDPDDLGAFSVVAAGSDAEVASVLAAHGNGGGSDAEDHVTVRIASVRRLAAGRVGAEWDDEFERMLAYARKKGWLTPDGDAIIAHIDRDPAALIPSITLNSGHRIPQLGFGVFRVPPDETERLVSDALEIGYRHLDTAAIYRNEEGVGRAIRASGIAREDLFVTTKLFNDQQGIDKVPAAFEASLAALGLDYVDLYLIHWPAPKFDLYVESWQALEEIQKAGGARSTGVSNFLPHHLERLLARAELVPAVNQIELHPILQQSAVVDFCRARGIAVEAWSPLGAGQLPLLSIPAVVSAATAHERTPAQIVLRWHVQSGNIVFPKSSSVQRMRENMAIFDFALTGEEMTAITALERGGRVGFHPDEWH
jgi:2,5-diketo-D-gluconate reductase A